MLTSPVCLIKKHHTKPADSTLGSLIRRTAILLATVLLPLSYSAASPLLLIDLDNCYCDAGNLKLCYLRNEERVGAYTPVGRCNEPSGGSSMPLPKIDLRADVNRDGMVSISPATNDPDERAEDQWNQERGATVLANIDDDGGRGTFSTQHTDAEDETINGIEDLRDLALLRILPLDLADSRIIGAYATITAPFERVHLFRRGNGPLGYRLWDEERDILTLEELRGGVELLLEARDVARTVDTRFIDIRVELQVIANNNNIYESSDTVRFRVAPVVFHHHLEPARTVLIAPIETGAVAPLYRPFTEAMQQAARRSETTLEIYPSRAETTSPWIQDRAEFGYMTAPRVGGGVQQISVALLNDASKWQGEAFGRLFSGRDTAPFHVGDNDGESPEAAGNFEVIPPYGEYPYGRVIRGSPSEGDPLVTEFLRAQELQPELSREVTTDWLYIGHIDELFSFLPAPNSRGWVVVFANPRLARDIVLKAIADGHGVAPVLKKRQSDPYTPESYFERTLNKLITSDEWKGNEAAIPHAEKALQTLIEELHLDPEREVISVPVLFHRAKDQLFSITLEEFVALTGNIANGTVLGTRQQPLFATIEPRGPIVNGKDLFMEETARAFQAITPTEIVWIDGFFSYHVKSGGIHCGSNVIRAASAAQWWPTAVPTLRGTPIPKKPRDKAHLNKKNPKKSNSRKVKKSGSKRVRSKQA